MCASERNGIEPEERRGPVAWLGRRLKLTEMVSLLTSYGLFYAELDTRKPLPEALEEAAERPLPSYSRWPRILGLLALVLLALEIVTGSLLTLYYLPTPEAAHASVGTVVREVDFGWLVHQLHFWGAQALVALLLVRVARFFAQRVYDPPHELVWVFAVLLLMVILASDLSGRLLPFTEAAYWSTVRALETVAAIPIVGGFTLALFGGEAAVSELTLIRFYVLHVSLLPLVALFFVYMHFSTVRRVGLSELPAERELSGPGLPRNHLANVAMLLAITFGVLVTLAVVLPKPMGAAADPFATATGIGPPWYLLGAFGLLEWSAAVVPRWVGGTFLLAALAFFVGLPFLDRTERGSRRRRLVLIGGLLLLASWVALSIYGARVA